MAAGGLRLLIIFVIRPVAGACALVGCDRVPWRERLAISFFGIRGIGSLLYLAYTLNQAPFTGSRELWSLVALVVVHGVLATPVMTYLDRRKTA